MTEPWVTRDGIEIAVKDMTTSHIHNALRMVQQRIEGYYEQTERDRRLGEVKVLEEWEEVFSVELILRDEDTLLGERNDN